jgi:hypothetical protein
VDGIPPEWLALMKTAKRSEWISRRLDENDPNAFSELEALAICALGAGAEIEVEPPGTVEGSNRTPDFRVRKAPEGWVSVEVYEPDPSWQAQAATDATRELSDLELLHRVTHGVGVQVSFRGVPERSDIDEIRGAIPTMVAGQVIDRPGYVITAHAMPDSKSIVVGAPSVDDRVTTKLGEKRPQLPKDGPGLICIKSDRGHWVRHVEQWFSPTKNTRVTAVLIFNSEAAPKTATNLGRPGSVYNVRRIYNPHPRAKLPAWLEAQLSRFPDRV